MANPSNRAHLEALVPPEAATSWERPERTRIFILFTPRSGSSWLGDLLRSTTVLGQPDEFLNQATNAELVRRVAARDEVNFLNAMETITASGNGVFSIEVVWGHMELSSLDLLGHYRTAHFVYLRRRDILAQAVSLTLATRTGVFHNPDGSRSIDADQAARLLEDPGTFDDLRHWWGHLMNYECLAEVQLLLRRIEPLRLYYEDVVQDPAGAVARVKQFCAIPDDAGEAPHSSFVPVGNAIGPAIAERFLETDPGFVHAMNGFRPPLR